MFLRRSLSCVPDGIVGWWKLNEGFGTYINDSAGQKLHNGNTFNSPNWVINSNGHYGISLSQANAQYIEISDATFADNPVNFSVSLWMRTTVNPLGGVGNIIIGKMGPGGTNTGQGWNMAYTNFPDVNQINFAIQKAGGADYQTKACPRNIVNDGNWHHIVGAIVNATGVLLYVDGAAQTTVANGGSFTAGISNPSNLRMGTDYDSELYSGYISDVRLYNSVLTDGQVLNIYNQGPL